MNKSESPAERKLSGYHMLAGFEVLSVAVQPEGALGVRQKQGGSLWVENIQAVRDLLFHCFQSAPSRTRSGFSQLLRGQLSMAGALPAVPQHLCGMVWVVLCSLSSPALRTACDHQGAPGVGTAGTLCHRQPHSQLLGNHQRLGHFHSSFFFILRLGTA